MLLAAAAAEHPSRFKLTLNLPVFMDYHSTTPVDPRVLDVMLPVLKEHFGNPASPHHAFGQKAHILVEESREKIASLIGSETDEIVFTSGATESNNLALKGVARAFKERGNHIISCVTEHTSVLECCEELKREGFEVTFLPVKSDGLIDLEELKKAITPKTILASVMAANNEIGVIQPIRQIGEIFSEKGILFHTDATQAVGKIPVDVVKDHIHLMSFSSHKMYGPKGIGALYVRKQNPRVRLTPLLDGGGHENGLRSGTLNTPAIVGFGVAARLAQSQMDEDGKRLRILRDRLKDKILDNLEGVQVNGSMEHRLPHNLNLSFAYVEGESLLKSFDTVALSSTSACSSVKLEVSYVLKSLGLNEDLVFSSIRFGLGRFNTEEEVDYVADQVIKNVNHLRQNSALYEIAKAKKSDFTLAKKPGESV